VAEAAHSKFSASAAHRWMACPGSTTMERGLKDSTSIHAATGTVAHKLLEEYLRNDKAPDAFLGRTYEQDGFEIEVDEQMVDNVQTAIDNILEATIGARLVMPETRVDYAADLMVPPGTGWGTSDVIAVLPGEVQVHDYKNGHRYVDALGNEQMKLYALGALRLIEDMVDEPIERVRMFIQQPRVNSAPSEAVVSVADLKTWGNSTARAAAQSVMVAEAASLQMDDKWRGLFLRPGEKQCQWCKAKGTCSAARGAAAQAVFGSDPATPEEFAEAPAIGQDLSADAWAKLHASPEWLAAALDQVDFIEAWCNAVRAEALAALEAGKPVPGYKLVQGKKGARAWGDKEAAEKLLKEQFRLTTEQAYNLKLISPSQAEKLATPPKKEGQPAAIIGPRQWKKAKELIVQPTGKHHVAPADDPRPPVAVTAVIDDFQPVVDEDDIT
jgi:hypothetical protein